MTIESRHLRQFLAVVELKSFTAAAKKLNMTQPALTRVVQQIEDRFGVKLIERGAKAFQLTPFGRMLAERARLIALEFAHIDSEMVSLKSGENGTLRIGTGPSGVSYLPAALLAFQEQWPNVRVQVIVDTVSSNAMALLNGELDLICTAMEFPRHPTLHCERLFEVRNVVIAAKEHPLASRNAVEPEDLLSYPWAAFANDEMARSRMSAFFAANALDPPQPSVEASSLDIILALLARSNYLACVPPLILDEANDRGLTALSIRGSFWSIGLGFAHLRTANLPSALATFIAVLRAHMLGLRSDNPYVMAQAG